VFFFGLPAVCLALLIPVLAVVGATVVMPAMATGGLSLWLLRDSDAGFWLGRGTRVVVALAAYLLVARSVAQWHTERRDLQHRRQIAVEVAEAARRGL
jgi:membrane protein implicated in regulation of membrane protease activity